MANFKIYKQQKGCRDIFLKLKKNCNILNHLFSSITRSSWRSSKKVSLWKESSRYQKKDCPTYNTNTIGNFRSCAPQYNFNAQHQSQPHLARTPYLARVSSGHDVAGNPILQYHNPRYCTSFSKMYSFNVFVVTLKLSFLYRYLLKICIHILIKRQKSILFGKS